MDRTDRVPPILKDILGPVRVGDTISITDGDVERTGILLPSANTLSDDQAVIKLANGYNIIVTLTSSTQGTVLERGLDGGSDDAGGRHSTLRTLRRMLLLSTGGTIASRVDYRTGAVTPADGTGAFLQTFPDIARRFDVTLELVCNDLSENLQPRDWSLLVERIHAAMDQPFEGVVVSTGTDILGYTAAALSYMLPNPRIPIVVIGAQRSSDRPSSDAHQNLEHALLLAAEPFAGVVVAMHRSIADGVSHVFDPLRTRKLHTSRRDAFTSVGEEHLAEVEDGIVYWRTAMAPRHSGPVTVHRDIGGPIAMVYFVPGITAEELSGQLCGKKGAIIMGTGLGNVATRLLEPLGSFIDAGGVVGMTSQAIHGTVNLNVYSTGRDLLAIGVHPLGDILPETAYVKLLWALGRSPDPVEVGRLLTTPFQGDMTERRQIPPIDD